MWIDESQVEAKWLEMAPLIDRMMERTDSETEFPVASGSSLSGDDRSADPYQVSHVVRLCLAAGVDHLHAAKSLVVDHQVLHIAAPSSLARGALENFAAACWILGPDRRADRIERCLRWHAKNLRDGENATAGLHLPERKPLATRLAALCDVGAKHEISATTIKAGYTSTEAVSYAEERGSSALPLGVLFPWRLSSGFAHGRPWAYLGSLTTDRLRGDALGVTTVRMSSDLGRALYPNLAAMHLLEFLLHLYARRSACHLL